MTRKQKLLPLSELDIYEILDMKITKQEKAKLIASRQPSVKPLDEELVEITKSLLNYYNSKSTCPRVIYFKGESIVDAAEKIFAKFRKRD